MEDFDNFLKDYINPIEIFDLPTYELSKEENEKVLHGQNILNKSMKYADFIILIYNGNIRAIAKLDNHIIKVTKVFDNA